MAKQYKGSLSLDWFNKQKSIISLDDISIKSENDIPAPRINWINKEEALFYELNQEEGKGNTPYWVNRDDIRVKEARPLVFQKAFHAVEKDKAGTIPGTEKEFVIEEITKEEEALDIDNMLIKGDNLLALNTLKKHFDKLPDSKKVKCVFIDPPYNTGKAFQQYDDNLEMSEWLSLFRDRLVKIYDIIAEDGFIWVTLDDKAVFYAKLLMDEVFGSSNFISNVIWQHSIQGKGYEGNISVHHNYILCYRKNEDIKIGLDERGEEHNKSYSNSDNDPNGRWRTGDVRNALYRPNLIYDIVSPSGKVITPPDNGWRWSKSTVQEKIKSGEIIFSDDESRIIRKIYLKNQAGRVPESIWFDTETDSLPESIWYGEEVGTTRVANKEIKDLFNKNVFDTPKPEMLLKKIIHLCTEEGDIVFDSFGGSGTTFATAQKMNRKWIGVEIGNHAEEVIIPRLKKVISYDDKKGITKLVNWQGGGSFKYYHLGESIINIDKETGKGEFNWSLGKQFIQESLLVSYDFIVQKDIDVFPAQIFKDNNAPTVGKLLGRHNKSIYGLSFLVALGEKEVTISNEEIKSICNVLRKQSDFHSLVIYTNKGIDIAQDAIPNDLDIIKVPHAIFAELER